jgi:hypothetical protein
MTRVTDSPPLYRAGLTRRAFSDAMSMVAAGAASFEAPESRKSVAIKMRPATCETFG